jgi:para-aminobenzoate synthetase component 1
VIDVRALDPTVQARSDADARPICLLESGPGFGDLGLRSIQGVGWRGTIRAAGRLVEVESVDGVSRFEADPLDALRSALAEHADPAGTAGGAIGYIGYNLCHQLDDYAYDSADDLGCPDLCFALFDDLSEVPSTRPRVGGYQLQRPDRPCTCSLDPIRSDLTRAEYEAKVARALEYIAAGDIYQVNISQRFHAGVQAAPWELYQRLQAVSAAPFSAFLDFGDFAVVSSSPERFWRLRGRRVEARPMKGTRPRGRDERRDAALARELGESPKDRAENIMIVDLLRNDIGRVCEYGSVAVPSMWDVESYSNVHQMTSTVVGTLRQGLDAFDLLRATFPPGSMTGAPKIRAMEIINELEPCPRGVYSGVLGYIRCDGDAEFSVIIRTIIQRGDDLWFQVGGAIVADSDPSAEYQESMDKAAGIMRTLGASLLGGED